MYSTFFGGEKRNPLPSCHHWTIEIDSTCGKTTSAQKWLREGLHPFKQKYDQALLPRLDSLAPTMKDQHEFLGELVGYELFYNGLNLRKKITSAFFT